MTADLALSTIPAPDFPRTPPRATGAAPVARLPAAPAPVTPNPRLHLDAPLGIVVLEFRDSGGDVANTIPSPRQIAAYRAAAIADAPVPAGLRARSAPGPEVLARPELPSPPVPERAAHDT